MWDLGGKNMRGKNTLFLRSKAGILGKIAQAQLFSGTNGTPYFCKLSNSKPGLNFF